MGPIANMGHLDASKLGSKLGVMRGFLKGTTLGGRTPGSFHIGGCKKICKIFESECVSTSGFMRGFQKGITLGGRTYAYFYLLWLQNRVAKKIAKFLHMIVDLSWGS